MPAMNYTVGVHNVGSYQVSGIPFATGSVDCSVATRIQFPGVTKWVAVVNHGTGSVKVGFSQNGMGHDSGHVDSFYLRVDETQPNGITLDVKVTEIWLSGSNSVDVMAGLTAIKTDRINNQTLSPSGSNWSGSLAAQV